MNTLAAMAADPVFGWLVAAICLTIACFPLLYIYVALKEDQLAMLTPEPDPEPEPEPWPQRQTPTDLAAAYEPTVERHLDWHPAGADTYQHRVQEQLDEFRAELAAFRWATGELERIRVDVRDSLPAVA